jgi:hypothetical protein
MDSWWDRETEHQWQQIRGDTPSGRGMVLRERCLVGCRYFGTKYAWSAYYTGMEMLGGGTNSETPHRHSTLSHCSGC